MERSFYNEDFEELIKQKADQYKMYPSDKVWKGIHGSLHPRKRWYWFGFFLMLSGAGYYTFNVLLVPSPSKQIAKIPATTLDHSDKDEHVRQAIIVPFSTPVKKNNASAIEATDNAETFHQISPFHSVSGNDAVNNGTDIQAGNLLSAPITAANNSAVASSLNGQAGAAENIVTAETEADAIDKAVKSSAVQLAALSNAINIQAPAAGTGAVITDNADRESARQYASREQYAPFEFHLPPLRRLSWQLSFSPTKNFRQVVAGGNAGVSSVKNVPVALNIPGNPNDLLSHDPAIGFELGSHLVYAVSRNFSVRAGVQFNYSRYNIEAYSSYSIERATIALNNQYGFQADSLTSYTTLQNFGGDNKQKLHNQYFQLSAPIGVDVRVLGHGRLQLHAGGTLQPTYLVNRNTYLITTDYKNYTEAPSLVRRWNLNTGLEAFLTYQTTTGLRWQLGPQFRYQLFSSYISEYPIREYLMEYGLRLAVSKVIR